MYARMGFKTDRGAAIDRLLGAKLVRAEPDPSVAVSEATAAAMDAVVAYDTRVTSLQRADYVTKWALSDVTTSWVARQGDAVVGYCVLCLYKDDVYRLGPLFADSVAVARTLTGRVLDSVPENATFTMDADPDDPKIDQIVSNRADIPSLGIEYIFTDSDVPVDKEKIFGYSQLTMTRT